VVLKIAMSFSPSSTSVPYSSIPIISAKASCAGKIQSARSIHLNQGLTATRRYSEPGISEDQADSVRLDKFP
jgi:hypothetical protein